MLCSLRRVAPVLVLAAIAPFVAEVLFGATPVSNLGAVIPEIAVYGGGAVLIRELVRRRSLGWPRIAALGVAYGLIEEGLALGSLFNPDLFGAGEIGGRFLGVNWVWAEWTLGYHAVWSVCVPILLAELLFPARRGETWLGRTGLIVVASIYALGVAALAAIFRFVVAPDFRPPVIALLGVLMLTVGLVALALGLPPAIPSLPGTLSPSPSPARPMPAPSLVGLFASVAGGAWFLLLGLPEAAKRGARVLVPMALGLALVGLVVALIERWSAPDRPWTDHHRLALAGGAMLASALVGFLFVTADNPVDRIGQATAGLIAAIFPRLLRANPASPVLAGVTVDRARSARSFAVNSRTLHRRQLLEDGMAPGRGERVSWRSRPADPWPEREAAPVRTQWISAGATRRRFRLDCRDR